MKHIEMNSVGRARTLSDSELVGNNRAPGVVNDSQQLRKGKEMNWKKTAIGVAMALGVVGAASFAPPFVQTAQAHQGMMGGYGGYGTGPGAGGYGGHHMGPGMMGGYGGYGMGPGTAGGYGGHHMGPGMMGGYGGHGMGPGMMGGYGPGAIYRLNLTDEQRTQVNGVQEDLRKKNWDLMGKMQDELSIQADTRGSSGKHHRSAILAADKRIFELRQQMLANRLDAQERIEALLTPQQKEQYGQLSQSRLDNDDYCF